MARGEYMCAFAINFALINSEDMCLTYFLWSIFIFNLQHPFCFPESYIYAIFKKGNMIDKLSTKMKTHEPKKGSKLDDAPSMAKVPLINKLRLILIFLLECDDSDAYAFLFSFSTFVI